MPVLTGDETSFTGKFGTAELVNVPDDIPVSESISLWLYHAPYAHPMWAYHMLYVVHLRAAPAGPEPQLMFPGATHEFGVMALNPEQEPWTMERYLDALRNMPTSPISPYLVPHDVVTQLICTDEEARMLAVYCSYGVANGALVPDSDGRSQWTESLTATLAHLRGQPHSDERRVHAKDN